MNEILFYFSYFAADSENHSFFPVIIIKQFFRKKMKKLALSIFTALLLCSFTSFAQKKTIEVGITGGPTVSSLRGNVVVNGHDSKIGFSSGVSFHYYLTDKISFLANPSFERKGSKTVMHITDEQGNPLGEVTNRGHVDYITLPLLTRFSFGEKIKFFANAGPYFSYLLKVTSIYPAFNNFPENRVDDTDFFKRFDAGLTFGAGAGLPIHEKIYVTAEVRNNLGLYDISDFTPIDGGTVKNNSINFLLGVSYNIWK